MHSSQRASIALAFCGDSIRLGLKLDEEGSDISIDAA